MNWKKQYIFTAIFCLIHFSCFPQFIVKENRIWSEVSTGTEGARISSTRHITFADDVNINDTIYKNILISNSFEPYNWYASLNLIREKDSIVYRRDYLKSEEYVHFDFSKKIGEVICAGKNKQLLRLDTILTKKIQGIDYKHWYLSTESGSVLEWIETLGTKYSVLLNGPVIGADVEILCITEDDELIFKNIAHNSCHISETSSFDLQNAHSRIYFYPGTHMRITMINNSSTTGYLTFYTSNGARLTNLLIDKYETEIHLPQNGLLLYRFTTIDGQVQSGKIIVN